MYKLLKVLLKWYFENRYYILESIKFEKSFSLSHTHFSWGEKSWKLKIFWTFYRETVRTVLLLRWCRRGTLWWRSRHAEAFKRMSLQSLASVILHPNSAAHRLSAIAVMTGSILSVSTIRLPTRTIWQLKK